jgi:hypothetical protein
VGRERRGGGENKRLMKCVCGRKNRTKPKLGTIGYTSSADSILIVHVTSLRGIFFYGSLG